LIRVADTIISGLVPVKETFVRWRDEQLSFRPLSATSTVQRHHGPAPISNSARRVCVCVCVCGYLYFMYQSYKSCLHAATSFFSFNAVVSASASQTSSPIPDALLGDAGAACRHTIRSCWLRIGFRIIIITQLPISRKGPVRPRHSVD